MHEGLGGPEWEKATNEEGTTYWINHTDKTTSWTNPHDKPTPLSAAPKYLPYEWWKPKPKDRKECASEKHTKTVGAFARLQARLRAKRSRELHGKRVEAGKPWAPFVTTKMAVVRKMMEVTNVGNHDVVVDLGSGEGRICITAALEYGAKAIGIEIDPFLANKSRQIVKEMGLQASVQIIESDWMEVDISSATVVTMFFISHDSINFNMMTRKLCPGTLVVSYVYELAGWDPEAVFCTHPHLTDTGTAPLFMYRVPPPPLFGRSNGVLTELVERLRQTLTDQLAQLRVERKALQLLQLQRQRPAE